MKKINIKFIAESAIIAALYAVLTWLFAPISYGSVQFRISEVLVLLVVFNPKYAFALIIGCFVSNITSTLGWYDMLFGTLATTLAIIPMCFIKKMPIAAIFPVISNAIIVSIELGLAFDLWGVAFLYDILTVGLGELVVLYALGIPLMYALAKNKAVVEIMELDASHVGNHSFITLNNMVGIALGVLGIILFIAYPFYSEIVDEEAVTYSAMAIIKNNPYTCIFAIASLAYGLMIFIKNKWVKLTGMLVSTILIIVVYILTGVNNNECLSYGYYYGYILFILLLIFTAIVLTIKNEKVEEA